MDENTPPATSTEPVYEERVRLTLVELCEYCRISADDVLELVDEGVFQPEGPDPQRWQFDVSDLKRLQVATRLQRDLRVNLAGAALALDLLDELERLRRRLVRGATAEGQR